MEADTRKTILIVDDTPENITILKEVLGHQYKIKATTNGKKALDICEELHPPDIILLDIMMPEMDGYEVCAKLKASPKTEKIPIIFISAKVEDEDEEKGLSLGAVDYITKPISPPIVIQRVRTQLELFANRQRLEILGEKYSSYLSNELVEGIKAGSIETSINSKKKTLSVFFSDIQGFTKKSEEMDADDLTYALNYYFESMASIIAKHKGTLDKFIGDAVMVFFGDPESHGEVQDASSCVAMAIEMQQKIPSIEAEWKRKGINQELKIRVGISTGICTVGNFGSISHLTYTIFGNNVNLAARLESNGIPGGVVISEATYRLVKDQFKCEPLELLELKGISNKVQAYKVVF
ncbi:MAG: response regulator [Leptospira sp.]|nr:response regulator [Leptospira sp.]